MERSRFVLACCLAVFLAGCGASSTSAPLASGSPSPGVSNGPSTPPTSEGPTSPGPTGTSPSSAPPDWEPVPDQAASNETQLTEIVWTGTRFVAAGELASGEAVFVDSTDGVAWNLQLPLGAGAEIHGLAATPAGVVAVGDIAVGSTGSDAASWSSKDGLTWTSTSGGAALAAAAGRTIRMNGVTSTGSGWLAVGEEDTLCQLNCGTASAVRALVWTSPDGLTWSRRSDATSLAHAAMNAVVRLGSGFVAVGGAPDRVTTSQVPEHAVVWTSADGRSWSRVADSPLFHAPAGTDQTFGDTMSGIATDGRHLVAVGTVGTQGDVGSALAWSSTTGRSWQRGTATDFLNGQLFNVAAVPGGFLGTGPSGTDSCLGGIWSSPDGAAWTCAATDSSIGGFAAYAAAASPTVMIVVGQPTPDVSIQSSIWTRPVP